MAAWRDVQKSAGMQEEPFRDPSDELEAAARKCMTTQPHKDPALPELLAAEHLLLHLR